MNPRLKIDWRWKCISTPQKGHSDFAELYLGMGSEKHRQTSGIGVRRPHDDGEWVGRLIRKRAKVMKIQYHGKKQT